MAGTYIVRVQEKAASRGAVARPGRGTGADAPTITVIYNGKLVAPRKMLGKEKISFQGFTVSAAANHPNNITLELSSPQTAVDERAFGLDARSRALLCSKDGCSRCRARAYPAIQFRADGQVLPGIKDVLQAVPTENPGAILNFLVNPDSHRDDRKPIDFLKAGQTELVAQAAANLAFQGA